MAMMTLMMLMTTMKTVVFLWVIFTLTDEVAVGLSMNSVLLPPAEFVLQTDLRCVAASVERPAPAKHNTT